MSEALAEVAEVGRARVKFPANTHTQDSLALYHEPDLYDLLAAPEPTAELAFYREEAAKHGDPVLELGVGTGRLAIPLAEAGLRVTGIDLLPVMLNRTRERAEQAGVALDLFQADMRDFSLGDRRFGLILLPNTTLPHLLEAAEIVQCFSAVARHLAPKGAFIFDVFNPSIEMLSRTPGKRYLRRRAEHPVLGTVTLEETFDYDPASQVNRVTWYWSTPARRDFFVHPLHMRHLFPQELPLLAEKAGLRVVERYGDVARSPFVGESRRQICVCMAADAT
ncbi:MAG: class I SAM-dependent methyltransferase [Rhodospirillaceae bacterium]